MELTIRMARPEDVPALLAIYAPYVNDTCITFEYEVPTAEEFSGRIEAVQRQFPYLVAEGEGELLGYAYASPFKSRAAYGWSVETSIYVRQDCRVGGIGSALYAKLDELLRRQHIVCMNACITYPNPPSERFHQKCGYHRVAHFEHCGYKQGQWVDVIWMQKLLCPLPKKPQEVIPIGQVEFE